MNMTDVKVDSSQLPLTESLKEEVEALEQLGIKFITHVLISFDTAIEIGEKLVKLKDKLPHGKFKVFITENIKSFNIRSAQNYMKIYYSRDEIREQLHDSIGINSALRYLRDKKKKTIPTAIEEQAEKTIDDHTKKLNIAISEFNRLERKIPDKILDYYNNNLPKKELLLEAVSIKKLKKKKTVEQAIEQINRMLTSLKKKRNKLHKSKKENAKLESIELLFKDMN